MPKQWRDSRQYMKGNKPNLFDNWADTSLHLPLLKEHHYKVVLLKYVLHIVHKFFAFI